VRPTFGGEPRRLLEVHLLDGNMDLYGLELGVEWVARLREERRFEGIDALKAQIALDARRAADVLGAGVGHAPPAEETGAGDRSRSAWA
jgi:riboflavin kinase/FMN adenylyltransferase